MPATLRPRNCSIGMCRAVKHVWDVTDLITSGHVATDSYLYNHRTEGILRLDSLRIPLRQVRYLYLATVYVLTSDPPPSGLLSILGPRSCPYSILPLDDILEIVGFSRATFFRIKELYNR